MKTIVAALAAVAALSTVAVAPAASAHPHGWHRGWHHPHPHKVCFFHHGHRVCRWR